MTANTTPAQADDDAVIGTWVDSLVLRRATIFRDMPEKMRAQWRSLYYAAHIREQSKGSESKPASPRPYDPDNPRGYGGPTY